MGPDVDLSGEAGGREPDATHEMEMDMWRMEAMEPAGEPKSSVFVKVVKMGQGGSDVERKEGDGKKKMGPGPDKRKAKWSRSMSMSRTSNHSRVKQSKAKQKHHAPTNLHLIRLYLIHLPTDRLAYLLFPP
ncbi:hypothetical protein CTAM01_00223 [Colletotrichum tamarilloi]|uniref:Uncharacterized protein n=1 Tax=Colletotrichum tamarilloi TaxID=1209934 RepID=A0ABQ9RTY4_9PEZI|nr:uncharacterized protein CTAM01_00223 [Colletotrichum tamarilloi]KAK1512828.1 hypothetical protein CTAM01_00223 [Colletotrichum tamarilloi]